MAEIKWSHDIIELMSVALLLDFISSQFLNGFKIWLIPPLSNY